MLKKAHAWMIAEACERIFLLRVRAYKYARVSIFIIKYEIENVLINETLSLMRP